MNTRLRLLSLLIIMLLFIQNTAGQEKTAVVKGKIVLPKVTNKKRRHRGVSYRSRHKTRKKSKETKSTSINSRYLDLIISAHPLTFKAEFKALPEAVKIFQYKAKFYPHVTPITPGTKIEFINKDKIYHNVFSMTPGAKFNVGRRPKGEVVVKQVYRLGEVNLFCDIHSHMNAKIISLDTPYFIRADDKGEFHLNGLPIGVYEVRIYHPDYQFSAETVELKAGDVKAISPKIIE